MSNINYFSGETVLGTLLTLSFSLPWSSPSSLVFFSRSCWSDDCCTCAACRRDDSSASFSLTDRMSRSFSACRAVIELLACSDTWQTKTDVYLKSLNAEVRKYKNPSCFDRSPSRCSAGLPWSLSLQPSSPPALFSVSPSQTFAPPATATTKSTVTEACTMALM